jgi:hypothetical protein
LLSSLLQLLDEAAVARGVGRFPVGVLWNLHGWSSAALWVYLPSLRT